jgi:hypothetical protein
MTILELFAKLMQEINAGRGHYRVVLWDVNESEVAPAHDILVLDMDRKQIELRPQ